MTMPNLLPVPVQIFAALAPISHAYADRPAVRGLRVAAADKTLGTWSGFDGVIY